MESTQVEEKDYKGSRPWWGVGTGHSGWTVLLRVKGWIAYQFRLCCWAVASETTPATCRPVDEKVTYLVSFCSYAKCNPSMSTS